MFSIIVRGAGRAAVNSSYGQSLLAHLKAELKAELKARLRTELRTERVRYIDEARNLPGIITAFSASIVVENQSNSFNSEERASELRQLIRTAAGLAADLPAQPDTEDLLAEFRFLHAAANILRPAFIALKSRRVLYCGQAYYNAWHLSRALRTLGWKADVYNWDTNPASQIYYHGEDFGLDASEPLCLERQLGFYLSSLYDYDVIHFSNAHGMTFGWGVSSALAAEFDEHADVFLLKLLGKKVVYSNNGCLDGVSQTTFAKWGPESVCAICRWQNEPSVCSNERNLAWGQFRNEVADYQCTLGGNRVDYNDDPRVHEVPEFYCLDPDLWDPDMEIPASYRLPIRPNGTVRLYHAVGNRDERTRSDGVNIKCSHIYLPLIEKLRSEGAMIELIEPTGIPNMEVRFLQAQADIFLDMLTFGWFGANAREAMMLGKPVVCFIRPEWLESVRKEIPDYADELPVVSATPSTVESVLRDLIANPERCQEIGRNSRSFALKWHSAEVAGKRFDNIYSALLSGDPLLSAKG